MLRAEAPLYEARLAKERLRVRRCGRIGRHEPNVEGSNKPNR